MAVIEPKKVNIEEQVNEIVKEELKNTPHDIKTHDGLKSFANDLSIKISSGFPSDRRTILQEKVRKIIIRHGEFHDLNLVKFEGLIKTISKLLKG